MLDQVRQLTRKLFRRELPAKSKAESFILDLLAVVAMRPAFLNDYFYTTNDKLKEYLSELRKLDDQFQCLGCLLIGDETYFIHKERLLAKMIKDNDQNFKDVMFIAAYGNLPSPKICTQIEINRLIGTFRDVIRELENANSNIVVSTMNPGPVIIALSGWLLQYAAIYYVGHELEGTGQSNCLANIPLLLVRVSAEVGDEYDGDVFEHPLLSFSAPLAICENEVEKLKQTVTAGLLSNLSNSNLFKSIKVSDTIVNLPAVAL
ncbi:hypothetical protein HDU76_004002 [Blyttiomyces sp. JEL0837]|nr:hypothetical protein HDU76_004002 [Blyttiomyces sp. JEL0837]